MHWWRRATRGGPAGGRPVHDTRRQPSPVARFPTEAGESLEHLYGLGHGFGKSRNFHCRSVASQDSTLGVL